MKEYQIIKGEKYICLKDWVMEDGWTAFIKGKVYNSHQNGCLINRNEEVHKMYGQDDFLEHFEKLKTKQ